MSTLIDKIDNALNIYYKSTLLLTCAKRNEYMNNDGIGKFAKFCMENGFMDEDVLSEIEIHPPDCMYFVLIFFFCC